MDIYRETILDHYKHPQHFGRIPKPTASASMANTVCGDRITMDIMIEDGVVTDVAFSGEGCAISMASASLLTETVLGKKGDDIMKLTAGDIFALLGTTLTPSRVKCALLPLEVLQKVVILAIKK